MLGRIHGNRMIAPALLAFMCIMLTSCATSPKTQETASTHETEYFEHTVRWPGENLSVIAKWYTGDPNNWRVIAEENANINPSVIKLGDKINIPRKLMTRTDPLPRSFVKAQMDKTKGGSTTRNGSQAQQPKVTGRPGKKPGQEAGQEPDKEAPQASSDRQSDKGYEPELYGPKE